MLSFIGALVALLLGALILNFAGQQLEGRKTFFLHFGWLTSVVLIGGAVFPFWGWTSTAWVLGASTVWTVAPPLWERYFGDGPPTGYLYHGDDPDEG